MAVVKNYLKNVTKSVTYAASDVYKELSPNIGEFADTNKEFVVAAYAAIKNPAAAVTKAVESIQDSKIYQALDYGVKNAFEDLRTGNFYNKEREDRDIVELSGIDTDMGLSEYGIDDDWESQLTSSKKTKNLSDGESEIIKSVEGSNAAVASATVNAVLATGEANMKNSRANVAMLYMQNERLFGALHKDISAVGTTVNAMHQLTSAALQNIDKNTSDFFTASLKLQNERNAMLREIVEMQRVQYKSATEREKEEQAKKKKKENRWDNIQTGDGVVDLASYYEVIKQNVKKNILSKANMPQFSEDGNMMAAMMTAPFRDTLVGFVKSLVPATLKHATAEFDKSFGGIFGNFVAAMANGSKKDNNFLGKLSKIFGINTSVNSRIDTGAYEKGPIPFDGLTRKAIIDVIPTYLRRIEAHLSQKPEQVFDYEAGRWVTMKSIEDSYKAIHKSAVNSAFSNVNGMMRDVWKQLQSKEGTDLEGLEKAYDEFKIFWYDNYGRFNPNVSAEKNGIEPTTYPNLYHYYRIIAGAFKKAKVGTVGVGKDSKKLTADLGISIKMNGPNDVLAARDAEERRYRELEKNVVNIAYQQHAAAIGFDIHGKWDDKEKGKFKLNNNANPLFVEDTYGNTVFNYLQNINKELTWQRQTGFEDLYGILLNMNPGGSNVNIVYSSINKRGRKNRRKNNVDTLIESQNITAGSIQRHTEDLVMARRKKNQDAFNSINLESESTLNKRRSDDQYKIDKKDRDLQKAIELITAGKALDISRFLDGDDVYDEDDDELRAAVDKEKTEEYILYLSDLLDKGNSEAFKKEIEQYKTDGSVEKWFAKHTNIKSISDVHKALEKDAEDLKESETESEKSFFSNVLKRASEFGDLGAGLIASVTDSVTEMTHNANAAIYDMMYHTKVEDVDEFGQTKVYDGFMDMITGRIKGTFNDLKDNVKNNIVNPFKKWFGLEDKEKDFTTAFKNELADMGAGLWKQFVDANKEVWAPVGNKISDLISHKDNPLEKARKDSRNKQMKNLTAVENISDITDADYLSLMKDYGLNFIEYSNNLSDAKSELSKKVRTRLFENTNGLREFDSINQLKLATMDRENDESLKKVIKSSADKLGIDMNGTDDNLEKMLKRYKVQSIQRKFIIDPAFDAVVDEEGNIVEESKSPYAKNRRRKEERDKINGALKSKWSQDLIAVTNELNFKGNREDKIKFLKDQDPTLTDAHIERLKTNKDLALRFLRSYKKTHNFAKGTMGTPFAGGNTMLSKGELLFDSTGMRRVNETAPYTLTEPTHILNSEDSYELLKILGMGAKDLGRKSTVQQDLAKENLIKNKLLNDIPNNAEANTIGVSIDKDKAKEIGNEAKLFIPEAAAGGLVGVIVSSLFNLIGGPLLGGAIGAAGTLVAKSGKLQEALFGKEKDGEREGGIVKKEIIDKAKKYFPTMFKYGMAGIIPGLITPLGPLGGLMAGAAFGYVKSNEEFKNKYFGKTNLILSESEKSIIKKLLPGAGKGAVIGAATSLLFGGPFGLLGNAVVGSAIGMMTTTDDFKESVFGREIDGVRQGGLLGAVSDAFKPLADAGRNLGSSIQKTIEENIIIPLRKFTVPLVHQIPRILGFLPRKLGEYIESKFAGTIESFIKNQIVDRFNPIATKVIGGTGKAFQLITTPVRKLGDIGDKMTAGAIQRYEADYMTAAERYRHMTQVMGNNNSYNGIELDKALMDMGAKGSNFTVEKAKALRDSLTKITDTETSLKGAIRNQDAMVSRALSTAFEGRINRKDIAKVEKLIRGGRTDEAMAQLRKHVVNGSDSGLTSQQFNDLMNSASSASKDGKSLLEIMQRRAVLNDRLDAVKNLTEDKRNEENNQIAKMLEGAGIKDIDINNRHDVEKLYKLLDTEIVNREANGTDREAIFKKNSDNITSLAENLQKISNEGIKIAIGATEDRELIENEIASKILKAFETQYKEMYDIEIKNALEVTGAESIDELNNTYSAETVSAIGAAGKRHIPFSKKTSKYSHNKNAIGVDKYKGNMSAKEIEAAKGNVNRIGLLKERGVEFNQDQLDDIFTFINITATQSQYDNICRFFNNKHKYIRKFCQDFELTSEDVRTIANEINFQTAAELNNKCKVLLSNNLTLEDIGSIKELLAIDITNYVNYAQDSVIKKVKGGVKTAVKTTGKAVGTLAGGTAILGAGAVLGTAKLGDLAEEYVVDPVVSLAEKSTRQARHDVAKTVSGAVSTIDYALTGEVKGNTNKAQEDIDKATITASETNEIDNPTDNREPMQVPGTADVIKYELNDSGDVEPDTTDSHTKDVLNKLEKKEAEETEANQAQISIAKTLGNLFGGVKGEESESNGGLFKKLLTGAGIVAALLNSDTVIKLFNSYIKPIWTDYISPFITDKAIPWIKDTALPFIGNTIKNLLPDLIEGGMEIAGYAVGLIVKELPDFVNSIIKGLNGDLDSNEGSSTEVTINGLKANDYNQQENEGLRDENGNRLTLKQIENGEYEKIYNEQGVEGTVSEDGKSITFEDQSPKGSTAAKTIGRAALHSLAQGSAGSAGTALKAVNSALKVTKRFGLVGKGINLVGKTLTAPLSAAQKVGDAVGNTLTKKIFGESSEAAAKAALNGASKKAAAEVTENAAKGAVSKASKNKKLMAKIMEKTTELIKKLFTDKQVLSKIDDAAEVIGEKTTGGFKDKLLEKVLKVFSEAGEKAAKEATEEVIAKTISKLNIIVTIAFAVVDFLTGYDRAEAILGVSEATILEKLACGIINAVVNLVPIFSIIPGVNWCARTLLGFLADIFDTNLKERQEEALKEYEEYQATTGSTKTQEEYLASKYSVTGKIGDWFSEKIQGIFNKNSKTVLSTPNSKDDTTETYGSGTVTSRTTTSKYGKGSYAKQIDPRIAGFRFNAKGDTVYQTIGDSGCGPAAAVNALSSMYGMGNNIIDAANFALEGGYKEKDGGTMPGFFKDYFANNGYASETSSNKSQIEKNIRSGMPTVLMGRDQNGVSSSTPYGRNPHYVTVTGIDKNGRAIVQDPESMYDNQLYSMRDLLSKTSFGVSAFGKSKYGKGDLEESMIWWYLKKMGMTDEGAAGMMGNIFAESGFKTNNMQNSYESKLGMNDNTYTAAVDDGSYTNFVNDRVGYGLAQWTSAGRKQALLNYIRTNNKGSVSSMSGQLEYLNQELQGGSYGNLLATLQSTNSVYDASYKVLKDFEQPNGVEQKKDERAGYANTYYNKFKGQEGTAIDDTAVTNNNPSSISSTSNDNENITSYSDILSSITGVIGDVKDAFSSLIANSEMGKLYQSFLNIITGTNNEDNNTNSNESTVVTTKSTLRQIKVNPLVAKLINSAQKQVGITGKPQGSNNVKYNDWYYGRNVSGDAYPWCAAFVSWNANEAGIPTSVIPKDAYTVTSRQSILNNGGTEHSMRDAEPGDIVYFDKNKGIYHTGIVEYNDGSKVHTIEGNVEDKVQRREFDYNRGLYVTRPNYPNKNKTSTITVTGDAVNIPSNASAMGSSGLKPISKFGQYKQSLNNSNTGFIPKTKKISIKDSAGNVGYVSYSGVDQKLNDSLKSNGNIKAHGSGSQYGMGSSDTTVKLINTIITILYTIADNTDKLNTIVSILNNKLGVEITSQDISNNTGKENLKQKLKNSLSNMMSSSNSLSDNSSLSTIINTMNAIAAE